MIRRAASLAHHEPSEFTVSVTGMSNHNTGQEDMGGRVLSDFSLRLHFKRFWRNEAKMFNDFI